MRLDDLQHPTNSTWHFSCLVGIFDAQDKLTFVLFCIGIIFQEHSHTANMNFASWTRCHAGTNNRLCSHGGSIQFASHLRLWSLGKLGSEGWHVPNEVIMPLKYIDWL